VIFQRETKYHSTLTADEIFTRLSAVTEKYFSCDGFLIYHKPSKYKFEGKITPDGFKIYPTFFWGSCREIFLNPEITGKFYPKDNHTEIFMSISLPAELQTLLIFALIPNVVLIILMIYFPILTDFPFFGKWWLYGIYIILTILLFLGYYKYKVYKSEKLLAKLLALEKVKTSLK